MPYFLFLPNCSIFVQNQNLVLVHFCFISQFFALLFYSRDVSDWRLFSWVEKRYFTIWWLFNWKFMFGNFIYLRTAFLLLSLDEWLVENIKRLRLQFHLGVRCLRVLLCRVILRIFFDALNRYCILFFERCFLGWLSFELQMLHICMSIIFIKKEI